MSRVSILSSGNAASASISACCAGVSRSELPFFIGSPFMRRCLAGADDTSHFLPGVRVGLRPRVHHEHDHMPNHADGLPPFFPRVWIAPTGRQGIAEHALGSLETQPMISFV